MSEVFGNYDFGLTQAQEERARRLHDQCVIVDVLFQGPCGYRSFSAEMNKELQARPRNENPWRNWGEAVRLPPRWAAEGRCPDYERCWRESGITAGTYHVEFDSAERLMASATNLAIRLDHLPWLAKALRAEDIRVAKKANRRAFFLNCQPMVPISRDLGLLSQAIDLGLRMMMLTYNVQDHIGSGCAERVDGGLSSFGVQVVRTLNSRGVIVDTSHCGPHTTLDACKFSEAPVVASHTSAKHVFNHFRAKSDEELDAIAQTGGVVGVYTAPGFLGKGQVTIEQMLDHIDYLTTRIGTEHVAIGTDWPLQLPKWVFERVEEAAAATGIKAEDTPPTDNLIGFDDYRDMPNITRGLVARGYKDAEIAGILGENFLRVFATVCG